MIKFYLGQTKLIILCCDWVEEEERGGDYGYLIDIVWMFFKEMSKGFRGVGGVR